MTTAIEEPKTANRDEIANLARQIWEREGCQQGRDQEYWFRAEQQLLAARQQAGNRTHAVLPNHRISMGKAKNFFRV